MAIPGMNPVTGLLAGATALALGPRAGFALGGVALIVTAARGWGALRDGSDTSSPGRKGEEEVDGAARPASVRAASGLGR
jgi:hypothetical protein